MTLNRVRTNFRIELERESMSSIPGRLVRWQFRPGQHRPVLCQPLSFREFAMRKWNGKYGGNLEFDSRYSSLHRSQA